MKIIKPGSHQEIAKPKRFTCQRCGCVFEADVSEYHVTSQFAYVYDGILAECKYPFCDTTAYAYE